MRYAEGALRLFPQQPVEPVPMEMDDLVVLPPGKWRWQVTAVSEHYVALTRSARFQPFGTREYTVLDWREGVRGPCNLLGQGYGNGTYSAEECQEMLAEFEGVRRIDGSDWPPLEVSHRNRVPLVVGEVTKPKRKKANT